MLEAGNLEPLGDGIDHAHSSRSLTGLIDRSKPVRDGRNKIRCSQQTHMGGVRNCMPPLRSAHTRRRAGFRQVSKKDRDKVIEFEGCFMNVREAAPDAATKLPLTFACGLYDRMLRLYTGEVAPAGIDLKFLANDEPRDIFDRMGGKLEFDASEMSSSEYISRFATGQCPFVAVPVFASRVFRHGFIFFNAKSGIRMPKDLEGKRVGVPLYTMSAAIWIRGLLQHEYGVDLSRIRWVQGALRKAGAHGKPTVAPLLKQPTIEINNSGKSLSKLLADGDIDAVISSRPVEGVGTNPEIRRMFANYREVEKDYYRRTRIFPIMHLVAIRRDVHEAHPFVAQSLYDALCESKDRALMQMKERGALRYMLPWLPADMDEIDEVFGGDPWPYGIEANRPTLEALVQYMVEQHFIPKRIAIEDLFVAGR
jgi:4,5-dihydroxyphthalate decarboxylase